MTDASQPDRTTKAFERLDLRPRQNSEPTVVVTEPTVAALPFPRASGLVDLGEPTAIVTESRMAALAALTAHGEIDGAETVPFEPVTGIALPTAPPTEAELAAAEPPRRKEPRMVQARGTGDRTSAAHRAVQSADERAANESTAVDPNALERIAAERAAAQAEVQERSSPQPARHARLGKYTLLRHLASGGTSHVFLARVEGPTGFSRHLVVKTLRREHSHEPSAVAAFVDEAWFLSTLHHGNIVQIFDVGAENGTHYLAMDYLHGETLRTVLQQVRATGAELPLDFAITAVVSCAEALHYVHTRHGSDGRWLRMVHRDVTPSNLMACYDGAIKLIDFGNAKAATRASYTPAGEIKGEAAYMAPEQARGEAVDLRSDVFSLGVVLYELTTRVHPFVESSSIATRHRLLRGEIKSPVELVAGYPSELARVVMTALAADPAMRYRDCGALGQALMEVADRLELRPGPTAVRQALESLFGAKPEAWVSSGQALAQGSSSGHVRTEQATSPSRRNKATRPLQPRSADRSVPLPAVPEAALTQASGGVVAARAAALPPSAPVISPSARVSAPPPPRLPAASGFSAAVAPPRPAKMIAPQPGQAVPAEVHDLPVSRATLPAAPPPPAAALAAAERARPPAMPARNARSARPSAAFDLVSPQEVQNLVEHVWDGAKGPSPRDQWTEALAAARAQHRAHGTAGPMDTAAAGQVETVTAHVPTKRRSPRLALELLALAAALGLAVAGPVLGQLELATWTFERHGASASVPATVPAPVPSQPVAAPPTRTSEAPATAAAPGTQPAPAPTLTAAPAAAPTPTAAPAPGPTAAPAPVPTTASSSTGPAPAAPVAPASDAAAATISVRITSEPPDALVTLDGKRLGKTPLTVRHPLQAGAGELRIRLPGHRVHRASVPRDSDLNLAVRLRPSPATTEPAEPVPDFMRAH